ncbi:hypothetical protein KA005_67470 [bacterium]|nr:hypothetical protein [bacterium]
MSDKTSKWLVGCGIGCGIIILLIVVMFAAGYFFCKDLIEDFKETEVNQTALEDRYGRVRDYCPDPDGAIKPERIEVFLTVRDSMSYIIKEMESKIDEMSGEIKNAEKEDKSFPHVFKVIKTGVGALPKLAEFYQVRNNALLEFEMGLGEYYYIYILAYYVWLDKSPGDGPEFRIMGGEGEDEWEERDYREERRDREIRRMRYLFRNILENQLDQLTEDTPGYSRSWKRTLEAEIAALREDLERKPYQDGLPRVIRNSMEPFRDRLEASYNKTVNAIDLGQIGY